MEQEAAGAALGRRQGSPPAQVRASAIGPGASGGAALAPLQARVSITPPSKPLLHLIKRLAASRGPSDAAMTVPVRPI